MGKYIKEEEREQLVLFPTSLEDMIESDNEVRDMLKLYLYGYKNKVRSSRKLMELTKKNVEVMWLIRKIQPDFRSISDFRKNNKDKLKEVFLEFNLVCKELNILSVKEGSQDGTKIRAVNAKDKNYTLNKIDDRIKRIKEQIEEYLKELETSEEKTKGEKLIKIEELEKRKEKYEKYRKEMEERGVNQKSLTDPESKLMKDNGAYYVCYNLQTLMGVGNHFVLNYQVTDEPADYGSMQRIIEETEEMYGEKVEKNVTDNGYSDRKDMMKLLENGTIPEVTPERGKEGFVLETEYEEREIGEKEITKLADKKYVNCILNGMDPILSENLIPVTIEDNGTVKKADTNQEWYKYEEKRWANAVRK